MKTKSLLIVLPAVMLCLSLLTSSAWAGSKQRHRWQGIAIGLGAAILGGAMGLLTAPWAIVLF